MKIGLSKQTRAPDSIVFSHTCSFFSSFFLGGDLNKDRFLWPLPRFSVGGGDEKRLLISYRGRGKQQWRRLLLAFSE